MEINAIFDPSGDQLGNLSDEWRVILNRLSTPPPCSSRSSCIAVSPSFPLLACRPASRRLGVSRHEVSANAVAGPGDRSLLDIPHEMRITGSGSNLRMTEKPADHRQTFTERQRPRGIGMPFVFMNVHRL